MAHFPNQTYKVDTCNQLWLRWGALNCKNILLLLPSLFWFPILWMYPVSGGITIGKPYHGRPWLQARTLPLRKTWTKAWRQGTKRLAWTNSCRACQASLLAGGWPRYGCWRPSEASMSETGLGDMVICRCPHTHTHTLHAQKLWPSDLCRSIQRFSNADITGVTINDYQVFTDDLILLLSWPEMQPASLRAFSCCFFITLLVLSGGAAS